MNNSTESNGTFPQCHTWLQDTLDNYENATIEEVNQALLQRYIGGIILLSIVILVGLVGNIHVLIVYVKKFKHSNYRMYVIWLAMLDLFNCTVVAPLVIAYHVQSVVYPSTEYCKFFRFVLYVISIASTSSLIVIAVDRYRKICYPLGWQFTSKHAKLLCSASLALAIFLSWPAPVLYGRAESDTGVPHLKGQGRRCFTENKNLNMYQFLFNIILNIYFFAVAIILIIVYIRISRHIKSHNMFRESIRRMSIRSDEELKTSTGARAQKSTYTLCVVTMAYICCAVPHHILAYPIFLVRGFDCKMTLLQSRLYYTFIWSYFVQSMVNPFIYAIKDDKFRKLVKDLYSRKKGKTIQSMIAITHGIDWRKQSTTTSDLVSECASE